MKGLNQYIVETMKNKDEFIERFSSALDSMEKVPNRDYTQYVNKHVMRLENSILLEDFIINKGFKNIGDIKNQINIIVSDINNDDNIKDKSIYLFGDLKNPKNKGTIFNQRTSTELLRDLENSNKTIEEYFEIEKYKKEFLNIFYTIESSGNLSIGCGEYFLRCMLSDIDSQNINKSDCDIYADKKFEVKYLNRKNKNSTAAIFGSGSVKENYPLYKQKDYNNSLNNTIYKNSLDKENLLNYISDRYNKYMTYKLKKDGLLLFIYNGNSNIEMTYLPADITEDNIKEFMKKNNLEFSKFSTNVEIRALS